MLSFLLSLAQPKKVLIFDAGSSSTRVYGYEFSDPKNPHSFVPIKDPETKTGMMYKKGSIKLSDAAKDEGIIDRIYDQLLTQYSNLKIPESERPEVRLMIYATAGMRYLSKEDQDRVLDIAYERAKKNFAYEVRREDFKVITGDQEAIYAWIGLNRLRQSFDNVKKTLPTFEIGGASSQIAAEVPKPDNAFLKNFVHDITIGGDMYYVFAHSWLGFGGDQTSLAVHKELLRQGRKDTPCALNGTEYKIKIDGTEHIFTGRGDYDQCYELISNHVFTKQDTCDKYPCIFLDTLTKECIPLPLEFEQIYAQGVPAFASEFLGITNTTMQLDHFENITRTFLKTFTYETAKNYSEEWSNYPFMYITVLQQILTVNFVKRGFSNIVKDLVLKAPTKIDGVEPQWTLGAVMEAFSPVVNDKPHSALSGVAIFAIVIGSIAIVVIAVFCIRYFIRKPKTSLNSSSSINESLV